MWPAGLLAPKDLDLGGLVGLVIQKLAHEELIAYLFWIRQFVLLMATMQTNIFPNLPAFFFLFLHEESFL